ncbi:ATP-binding protein [Falsochrobactrum sp. TDYN1]|uniref:ATP-binding protein n=1 Tax=Falsochrobactrum tianjinense TaxID=2706015 RepID=A0A949UW89_9HYPH|nr:ATP-binding protein [Falsochrobactrum sp. TDYN1]MBV2145036.1 ATP-binding protein [Falsochrobactrum sp. TDYN1]
MEDAAFKNGNRDVLLRIAEALERLTPPVRSSGLEEIAEGYLWQAGETRLKPVTHISRIDIDLLKRVDSQRATLLNNTRRFARGEPANNALLWGARGTGKSSLVKAVHATVNHEFAKADAPVALVEIQREDIGTLPELLALLETTEERRFILFCDDLSFDAGDAAYKSLKAVLDGGIAGRPENVIFYATSNRRHILARDMIENEQATAINPGEAVEEKVSLSDRFGLWLGFHNVDQDGYLDMVLGYAEHLKVAVDPEELKRRALEWAMQRGSRSGRTAWQFIQSLPANSLNRKASG